MTERQEKHLKARAMKHVFLEESGVRVLKEGFVGRRRQMQQAIKTLTKDDGKELADYLSWLAIYRDWVQLEGVGLMAEKAGLDETQWKQLLDRGMALSLMEHDRALELYRVTPLLREELAVNIKDCTPCHESAFQYYRSICEDTPKEEQDLAAVEEWVYFALACGEEEIASRWGGRLVLMLRDGLAFLEAKRIGLWVLKEKQAALTTVDDAHLLEALGNTLGIFKEHEMTISFYEQSLAIFNDLFGPDHEAVAIVLNNLGTAYYLIGDKQKAIALLEEAYAIFFKFFGEDHPNTRTVAGRVDSE